MFLICQKNDPNYFQDLPEFPVLLILNLKGKSQLTKIQLLGHAYMIPQRVTLYCGDFTNKHEKKIWKKIGYITFNENSAGKQRELKTISLHEFNVQGRVAKLRIRAYHRNLKILKLKVKI